MYVSVSGKGYRDYMRVRRLFTWLSVRRDNGDYMKVRRLLTCMSDSHWEVIWRLNESWETSHSSVCEEAGGSSPVRLGVRIMIIWE